MFLGHGPNAVLQSSKADELIKTDLVATHGVLGDGLPYKP